MRFTRLSHQVLLVFTLVVIVALGLSGWAITALAQRVVEDNVARGHVQLAQRIAEEIDLEVDGIRPILLLLAESPSVLTMEPAAVASELSRYENRFAALTSLYVADADGQQVARTDDAPLEDVSSLYGFQIARQGHELLSDVYLSQGGKDPMLTVHFPITREGDVVGVLVADVSFARLQNIVEGLNLRRSETALVLAPNGRVVAHSGTSALAELPALSDPELVESLVRSAPGVVKGYRDELGRKVVGVHAPVRELDWAVVIQTPVGEFASEVVALRRTMALALLGGVALALGAGWLTARQLTRPIHELAQVAERVAAGELDISADVDRADEIGVLAQAFNTMTDRLRDLIDHLEERVAGRTAELETATQEARQRAEELAALYEVGRGLATTLDLDILLPVAAGRVAAALQADRAAIFLMDERADVLRVQAAHGYDGHRLVDFHERPGDGFVGQAYASGETRYVPDLALEPEMPQRDPLRAVLAVPLASPPAGSLGVLTVASNRPRAFNADQRRLLETMAGQIARAIRNAQLLEAAQEADRLKSAFLATMSHELRTPLNSIIGFIGILRQGLAGPLNDEQMKQLGMAQRSARHLLDLINDVLDISKIEAGQVEIAAQPFDMREAIEAAVRSVRPLAEKKGLSLVSDVSPQVGEIVSDRRRVEQVLINLLNNAVKFTDSGEVCLACWAEEGWTVTQVEDTGIGIKPEDREKLFKPFRQIDTGLSRRYGGTGLGLSICKRLVETLGGSICVESEWGEGSTFTFTLPAE